jgi:hypothetical protein
MLTSKNGKTCRRRPAGFAEVVDDLLDSPKQIAWFGTYH